MKEISWLDYSSGGVPAGMIFKITLDDLKEIVDSSPDQDGINILNEICFIGLISYFEGFCKDLFSSIINIVPELIENLKSSGQDVSIDSTRVLLYSDDSSHKIGFLVAEKYDFGSAKKINFLFNALLNLSPFSKNKIKIYDDILRDRNLFVHHGGTYTLTYLQLTKLKDPEGKDRAFFDSLVLDKKYILKQLDFIERMALKMLQACNSTVNQYILDNDIHVNDEQQKAIDAFLQWN